MLLLVVRSSHCIAVSTFALKQHIVVDISRFKQAGYNHNYTIYCYAVVWGVEYTIHHSGCGVEASDLYICLTSTFI